MSLNDTAVFDLINEEEKRQLNGIELIASENFTSPAVMKATGSVLTNKYAEGYPGKRYYGGCENVDLAEALAIERAKELFGADHANVQPHRLRHGQVHDQLCMVISVGPSAVQSSATYSILTQLNTQLMPIARVWHCRITRTVHNTRRPHIVWHHLGVQHAYTLP